MSTLGYIVVFSLLGSVVSLIGGLFLLFTSRKGAQGIAHLLAAFAAGALLGTTFFDLLPEALEESAASDVMLWTLVGILCFFVLERFIHWFHHHELHHHEHAEPTRATVPLIVLGDTVHNFIDGVVIASTFMVDIQLGMITTLAVAAHEIPQEIGDFGILLHAGVKRRKVLLYNLLSALATLVAALATYAIGTSVAEVLPTLLAVTAGFFIYISLSDLIPGIHSENRERLAIAESLLLFAGVGIIWLIVQLVAH